MMTKRTLFAAKALGAAVLLGAAVPSAAGGDGTLHIVIDNVRGAKGLVHADLCTQAQFLGDCTIAGEVPAYPGVSTVTLSHVKPGRYAVQATYDENGNHKVDRALFGLPKEGVGFSRDARITLHPPRWDDAMFDYDGHETTIRLRLRYFIGPNYTPPAK